MTEKTKSQAQTEIEKVAAIAAASAAILALIKLGLFAATGSLIIGLSAWDSTVDCIISLINRKVIHFARQDADENHPYGHGKAEYIAALAQGCMIVGGGITILVAAIKGLWNLEFQSSLSENTISPFISAGFFVVFALVSAGVTFFMKSQGKRLSSPALQADATHYAVDVATNGVTAISLVALALTQWNWLDPLFSILLSIYLGFGGVGLIVDNTHNLMDRALPKGMKDQVLTCIFSIDPRIKEIHRFRGRVSGYKTFLDFHVCLPKNLSFEEAHLISDEIEKIVSLRFQADVVVHTDIFDGNFTPDSIVRPSHLP